jgi:hypothetical protein
MPRILLYALASSLLVLGGNPLKAALIKINFSGSVIAVSGNPFSAAVQSLNPVSGFILYESTSPSTHSVSLGDSLGYRQQIVDGFHAQIGGAVIQANDYVVEVKNNFPQGPTFFDTISIRYANTYSPPLEDPLQVNGTPFPDSLFQINFDFPSTTFSSSALPNPPNFAGVTSFFNVLDEIPTDLPVSVLFQITAVSVPEPATSTMMIALGSCLILFRRSFRQQYR